MSGKGNNDSLGFRGLLSNIPYTTKKAMGTAGICSIPGITLYEVVAHVSDKGWKGFGGEIGSLSRILNAHKSMPIYFFQDFAKKGSNHYVHDHLREKEVSNRLHIGGAHFVSTFVIGAAMNPLSVITTKSQLFPERFKGSPLAVIQTGLPEGAIPKAKMLMKGTVLSVLRDMVFVPTFREGQHRMESTEFLVGSEADRKAHPFRTAAIESVVIGTLLSPVMSGLTRVITVLRKAEEARPLMQAFKDIVEQDGQGCAKKALKANLVRLPASVAITVFTGLALAGGDAIAQHLEACER